MVQIARRSGVDVVNFPDLQVFAQLFPQKL
jgi:hypothetical protein